MQFLSDVLQSQTDRRHRFMNYQSADRRFMASASADVAAQKGAAKRSIYFWMWSLHSQMQSAPKRVAGWGSSP